MKWEQFKIVLLFMDHPVYNTLCFNAHDGLFVLLCGALDRLCYSRERAHLHCSRPSQERVSGECSRAQEGSTRDSDGQVADYTAGTPVFRRRLQRSTGR